MGTLTHDLRYGARMLWKSRGFTLASVLVLALGIGATTANFSVVNSVLLRPLPYPESERLLVLWGYKDSDRGHTVVTYPDLEDWRAQTQTLEYIAAFNPSGALLRGEGGGEPEPLSGAVVSADLFPMLGVRPVVGRAFTREEDRAGAPPVVIIGHDLWRRRFNSDPSIVGRQIRLGSAGVPTTVVGVLPQGFSFPPQAAKTEFLRPVAQAIGERTKMRGSYSLPVVARLKAGATVRQAEAEMRAVGERLEQLYPDEGFRLGRRFAPLDEEVAGTALRRSLLVLLGAVGFVLLIACANVANLLLTRATARHREIAIRTALGASRGRIVRQLLTESLLLSAAGGAAGLLLATWGTALLTSAAPADIPRLNEIGLDARVLVFAVAVSLLTGVVFGLAPALQALRVNLQESLKEGGRSASAGAARSRLRSSLVVAEVALSLVLLVGAGLLVRSFARLTGLNPGFDPQNVLTVTLSLPRQKYAKPEQQLAAFSEIVRRVGEDGQHLPHRGPPRARSVREGVRQLPHRQPRLLPRDAPDAHARAPVRRAGSRRLRARPRRQRDVRAQVLPRRKPARQANRDRAHGAGRARFCRAERGGAARPRDRRRRRRRAPRRAGSGGGAGVLRAAGAGARAGRERGRAHGGGLAGDGRRDPGGGARRR
jgi:putative ABC transport system permease protein